MRFYLTLILSFALAISLVKAQNDTSRVLFIGNSFTYFNNMPQMVKAFADSAHIPIIVGMHAPGGVSVGDTAQGNMAHMNNPVLFKLIRSQKWDFAVIQDNQGRFVRDSATFPASSKVVQGHLNIMDSVKANNSCAKIVLFAGWAFKNGSPPYGNTGIEMIKRILVNYRVLNDTMKEVVAPIGEAWIKSHSQIPGINLWDSDDAHPSYAGSYITASVIFSSIFSVSCSPLTYNANLPSSVASNLKAFGDSAVFKPPHHPKYNLGGIRHPNLIYSNGILSVAGSYISYTWYKDGIYIGNASTQTTQGNGAYQAIVQENDGCILKTCKYDELATGIAENGGEETVRVFPNPAKGELFITASHNITKIKLINLTGSVIQLNSDEEYDKSHVNLQDLKPGCYILEIETAKAKAYQRIVVAE